MPPKTPKRGRPSSAQGSAVTCVCAAIFWLVSGWAGWRIYHAQSLLVIPYVMNLLTSGTLILSSLGVKGLTRVYGDLVAIARGSSVLILAAGVYLRHVLHWKMSTVNDWTIYVAVGAALTCYLSQVTGNTVIPEAMLAVGLVVFGYVAYLFKQMHLAIGIAAFASSFVIERTHKTAFGPFRYIDILYLVLAVGQGFFACGILEL